MLAQAAAWVHEWLTARGLERGIDARGRLVAPIERRAGGAIAREVRVSVTRGDEPLLVFQVQSADRVSTIHRDAVAVAVSQWNARQRCARVWWVERDATLRLVVELSVPLRSADATVAARAGDEVVDAAIAFWRWVDLHAPW